MMILNKRNLQHGLFRNYMKRWLKEEEPVLYITDPFNRKADSIKIIPDEYGAISGSYIIPKNAATGEWEIDADFIDKENYNEGSFTVEEYKRPTFELTVDKPSKTYTRGEPFSFTIRARSFAGASLNNVRIQYSIKSDHGYTIADTTAFTGADGKITITVTDSVAMHTAIPDSIEWKVRYRLSAEATDPTGESHEIKKILKFFHDR